MRKILLITLLLAAAPAKAANFRIGLCLFGCPAGSGDDSHLILRPIYVLSYNITTKVADWVAYKVSAQAIGVASSLSRTPRPDPYIDGALEAADFEGLDGVNMARSRLVPLVSFAGTPYWDEVNFLTAQAARTQSLNQGAWYGIEWAVRNLVNREGEVYVITGSVFYDEPVVARLNSNKPHRVPDAFFKIVATESGRGTAFLLPQDTPIHVHHCDTRSSLGEIARLTGLLFFPERPGLVLQPLDSSLGCD